MKITHQMPITRPFLPENQEKLDRSCTIQERVELGLIFAEGAMPLLGTLTNGFSTVFGADWNGTSAIGALANVAGTAALLGGIPGGKLAAAGLLGLSGAILAHTATTGAWDN